MKQCNNIGHRLESITESVNGPYKCTRKGCDFELLNVVPDITFDRVYRGRPMSDHARRYDMMLRSCELIINENIWSLRDGTGIPISALDSVSLQRLLTWLYHNAKSWKNTTDVTPRIADAIDVVREALSAATS